MTKFYITMFLGFILACTLFYFSWSIGRYVNYNLSYKDMVVETIKEQVKAECLK